VCGVVVVRVCHPHADGLRASPGGACACPAYGVEPFVGFVGCLRCGMFPLTLTLSLQGEGTVRARPSNVIAFVGRVRRSRHPALLLWCQLFPLTLTLSLQGEGIVRARPSNVIAFVGRVRRSRHPALLLRCHMFPLTLTLSLQ